MWEEGDVEGRGGEVWSASSLEGLKFEGFEWLGRRRNECACERVSGVKGGENVRASRHACNVFFHLSTRDMAPGFHQLTCRPKTHKMAVSCLSCRNIF